MFTNINFDTFMVFSELVNKNHHAIYRTRQTLPMIDLHSPPLLYSSVEKYGGLVNAQSICGIVYDMANLQHHIVIWSTF